MRRCGTCFRYCEDWRDAMAKGLAPVRHRSCAEYSRKPRKGVAPHALGIHCPDDKTIHLDHPACRHHKYRWLYNIGIWWRWRFVQTFVDCYRAYIRVPLGGLRKPAPLKWVDAFDGMADRMIPNGEPECPHCGEMPYSYEQCVFCGQRFLPDDSHVDKTAPQRDMREGEPLALADGVCPECGRSCSNGGCGPLRCRCGWVGEDVWASEELRKAIEEVFAEEWPE